MKLLYELSKEGRNSFQLPHDGIKPYVLTETREKSVRLPDVAEIDLLRYYQSLSKRVHCIESGFYPLGSCTMKYNPKINDAVAGLPGFSQIHPLQDIESVEGAIEVYKMLNSALCEVTGMDAMSMQPAAGAHGEFTALLAIRAYHHHHSDYARTKVIIPDSAHGTNPASAVMAGFDVVSVPSDKDGFVDIEALKAVVGKDTAALMLTNPNTLGKFEKGIKEITDIIHNNGGLVYYDGANLNAVMGIVRPGDMGFDIVHLNLHKTFSTPHGGGGPGSGPIGCKELLIPFLPKCDIPYRKSIEDQLYSIGKVRSFHGNFLVSLRALVYMVSLGGKGLRNASEMAVLNANYLYKKLAPLYEDAADNLCMHEFVVSAEPLNKECGVRAIDIAKGMMDQGVHPPTIYFPLIVKEAMMFEPTETESIDTLNEVADKMTLIFDEARRNPDALHNAPVKTPIGRADEVLAARNLVLKYSF